MPPQTAGSAVPARPAWTDYQLQDSSAGPTGHGTGLIQDALWRTAVKHENA